ncbi:hypothetical protein MD588_06250 [Photobacterium sp. SDRW27]|uniref:hypothetical protein n=1 Tax=Photobacterium obscurum TaxID=2829490 RepID=UPI0022433E4A|nr:hypothetical protein [Photobacterium obscurum]MCW8328406.1 hypothetical protein [Photobacterium obscurum]
MKNTLSLLLVLSSMVISGCGGEDSSSGSSVSNNSQRQPYKTQLSIDASDLQELKSVKYASNDGAGFSTPENFQK